jgi:hypothetical protein
LIPVDFNIVRQVGAQAFVVYAALAEQADHKGIVRVSRDDLAKTVGVGISTVKRCRKVLIEAGLIKVEQSDGQENAYRLIGNPVQNDPGQNDRAVQNEPGPGFPVITNTCLSPSTSLLKEEIEIVQIPETRPTPHQSGALRAPLSASDCQTDSGLSPTHHDHAPRAAGAHNGRKPVSVDQISRKPGRSWQDFINDAETLVAHFERPVIERTKAEYARRGHTWRGKGLDKRRESWQQDAIQLLEHHPIAEVIETVDFVFGTWEGYLPTSVTGKLGKPLTVDKWGRPLTHDVDLKVTRLRLIRMGYDSIRDHMAHPEITAERKIPAAPKPKPKKVRQADVDDLLAQFTDFRASAGDRHVDDHRKANWADTFRVMLRQYSADDIKAVIAAVRACPEYVDQGRYRNAYALNRPGEWENLQGTVELHRLKQKHEAANPVRRRAYDPDAWRDGDEFELEPPPIPFAEMEARRLRRLREVEESFGDDPVNPSDPTQRG